MNPQYLVLRTAEALLAHACKNLPEEVRQERFEEWRAELPAILSDPDIKWQPMRAAIALLFASDQFRCTRKTRLARNKGDGSAIVHAVRQKPVRAILSAFSVMAADIETLSHLSPLLGRVIGEFKKPGDLLLIHAATYFYSVILDSGVATLFATLITLLWLPSIRASEEGHTARKEELP